MADLEREDVAAANAALMDEVNKWETLQLPHPAMVIRLDMLSLVCRVDAMAQLLVEKGVLEENEFYIRIQDLIRQKMEEMRPKVHEQVIKEQNKKVIYGANGKELN